MTDKYQPSWWELRHLHTRFDLAIVGAGLTGLFSALFYKRLNPDHNVIVLERGFYPDGASTRNAGFACFGSAGELLDDLRHESEMEVYARLEARFRGLERLRREMGDENLSFEQPGGYELFTDVETFGDVTGNLSLFNKWLKKLSGIDDVYSVKSYQNYDAVYCSLEGRIDSGKFMKSLIGKVQDAGIYIRWNANVTRAEHCVVELFGGVEIETDKILLATNGFTSTLAASTGIRPARGYVFVTEPINNLVWKGIFHYDCGYYYFRDLPGNRMLIGGARNLDSQTEETTSRGINEKIKSHLIGFANNILDLPEGWSVGNEWTGTMGFGPTKTPICKKLDEGVFVAAGLSGMGVAIGTDLAERTARMISADLH
ncbi:MAG: NAD(P)/FAD-dependent oxidoreductase [Cyclonatronaceae bacterium]